jgi:hypothetical protein
MPIEQSVQDTRERMAAKRKQEEQDQRIQDLTKLIAMAAPYQELVGHAAWNPYVNKLEEWKKQAEVGVSTALSAIASLQLVGHDELMKLKLTMAYGAGRRDAFLQAINLPTELLAEVEKATEPDA